MRSERSRRERVLDIAAIVFPTAVGGALALYELGARSIWLDEAASVTIAAQHGAGLGAAMAHDGGNMLAYYALLHVLIGAFGNGVDVMRAPSAIAVAAAVAMVALLAARLFDRRVALASGLLFGVSLPLVYWGQQARAYAPMVALVAASYLAFAVLMDRGRERASPWIWAAYVVVTTLALYMSFVAALVIPAQLLVVVWCRQRLRPFLASAAVTAVLCVPLAVLARQRGSGQLFWVPRPSLSGFHQVLESLTSAAFEPNFAATSTSQVLLWLTVAALAGAAAVGAGRRSLGRSGLGSLQVERRSELAWALLVAWLVVPVVLAWAESEVGQSIFLPRNLLLSLPPVAVLLASAAIGGGRARRRASRSRVWWGWLGLAGLLGLRALQLVPTYGVSPEDWRSAVSYVVAHAEPSDCIAFYPSDGRMAFEYYLGGNRSLLAKAPKPVLPALPWGEVRPYVEQYTSLTGSQLTRISGECARLWLVASHQGQRDGPPGSVADFERYEALQSSLAARFSQSSSVSFGYAAIVQVELLSH